MSILNVVRRLTSSPLNRDRKLASLWRFAKWQFGSRLVPGKVLVDWVAGVKFVAGPGEHGLTGNVYHGLHEFQDMAYVLHVLEPTDVFVDVGANVGSYSLLACGAAGARGYALEPVPSTYRRLLTNLAVNDLLGRVTPLNQGAGESNGVLRFTAGEDCTNHVLADGETAADAVEVPVKPLDESIDQPPAMMKIDVEGYETMVLRGATRLLADRTLNSLLIELNGSGARYGFDEGAILSMLEGLGFRPYQYDALQRRLDPLEGRSRSSGNTLFIRDVEQARRRVAAARRYKVLGREV
jgi:FkbM family methyltransferase